MRLKKYLNTLSVIDPGGRIGEFVENLTYLEARALKDLICNIDASFEEAIASVTPKVEKLHMYSGIFQHYIYEIGDITIEADIGNCLDTYEYINDFVGIKVSMTYYGSEEPLNITIKSSDKNASGYIDYHDWGEFGNIFVETINRYIKSIKKGSPKFKYLFDKESKSIKHSESRLNVKEDLSSYIKNLSDNDEISEYIQNLSTRQTRYIPPNESDDYIIPLDEEDEYLDDEEEIPYEENTYDGINDPDEYTSPDYYDYLDDESENEDSKIKEEDEKAIEPEEPVLEEPVIITHNPSGLVYNNFPKEICSNGVVRLVDANKNNKPIEQDINNYTEPVKPKEVEEVKDEIKKPEPKDLNTSSKIILNKKKKRRS